MQTHIKSKHLESRPFQCKFCEKSFKLKAQLKVHLRIHTGERPYTCSYCSRTFSQQNTLKQHERIHTGERPFQCKICFRTYTQKSALVYHVKKHQELLEHSNLSTMNSSAIPSSLVDSNIEAVTSDSPNSTPLKS